MWRGVRGRPDAGRGWERCYTCHWAACSDVHAISCGTLAFAVRPGRVLRSVSYFASPGQWNVIVVRLLFFSLFFSLAEDDEKRITQNNIKFRISTSYEELVIYYGAVLLFGGNEKSFRYHVTDLAGPSRCKERNAYSCVRQKRFPCTPGVAGRRVSFILHSQDAGCRFCRVTGSGAKILRILEIFRRCPLPHRLGENFYIVSWRRRSVVIRYCDKCFACFVFSELSYSLDNGPWISRA